jgi:hypothetical protein
MRATGPAQPGHLLLDVVDILIELGLPYALVGAFAVSYYGVPRYTGDADAVIWSSTTGASVHDLNKRLVAAGYRVQLKRGDLDDPISRAIIVEDQHDNRIDLLSEIRGMDPDAPQRCVSASLLDSSVWIIAAEDLVAMKIFAGGIQDLEDVRGILQVSRGLLNLELLRKLASRYGTEVTRTLDALLRESTTSGLA